MRGHSETGSASVRSIDPCLNDSLTVRLGLVADGDIAALGELFTQFGDLVYRTALRLTGSRPDAEDVTQELFLRLPVIVAGFAGDADGFPMWLRRVAVRQALTLLRTGRRRREVDVGAIATLVAPATSAVDRLTINAALARLSMEQRQVFVLKEVEGYTHIDIADLLGITTSASEVRLHRARHALRELLRGSR